MKVQSAGQTIKFGACSTRCDVVVEGSIIGGPSKLGTSLLTSLKVTFYQFEEVTIQEELYVVLGSLYILLDSTLGHKFVVPEREWKHESAYSQNS